MDRLSDRPDRGSDPENAAAPAATTDDATPPETGRSPSRFRDQGTLRRSVAACAFRRGIFDAASSIKRFASQ